MSQALISSGFVADNVNTNNRCFHEYGGTFSFTTTGATVTIKVPDLFRRYHVVGMAWCGTPAADEILSVPAPASDGTIAAEGSLGGLYITITRTGASKTSGLSGSITIRAVP